MGAVPLRKILLWASASLAVLVVVTASAGYLTFRHLNSDIEQANVTSMLGRQPTDAHPGAENILVIGSDTPQQLGVPGHPYTLSDTLALIHIPASRAWAQVMSIPPDSWVKIPSCQMGNGRWAAPTRSTINEAFAIGDRHGHHAVTGAACVIKTIEQDTGIYIDHFIVMDYNGFRNMVAALGGVTVRNPTPVYYPPWDLSLSAGWHTLTPDKALTYVRYRSAPVGSADLGRIMRQEALMSALVSKAKGDFLDPLAIYQFLAAATQSLTIDSQLGGITGLYELEQSLHGIPPGKLTFFALPSYPRREVVPTDTTDLLWTQPQDDAIFAAFRNDVPASPALFGRGATGSWD
jgi:LCP family protein required for cell wall assembly